MLDNIRPLTDMISLTCDEGRGQLSHSKGKIDKKHMPIGL